MSDKLNANVIGFAKNLAAKRPNEVKWTAIGGVSGVPVGLAIGGVSVAALGGAVGIPAFALCSIVGAAIGNRVGMGKDLALSRGDKDESN